MVTNDTERFIAVLIMFIVSTAVAYYLGREKKITNIKNALGEDVDDMLTQHLDFILDKLSNNLGIPKEVLRGVLMGQIKGKTEMTRVDKEEFDNIQ